MLHDILRIRGVTDVDIFLNVTEDVIEDFKLYDNILEARNRILHHIINCNKVLILVDFDSDGHTSSAILYSYLKEICRLYNKDFNVNFIQHDHKEHGLTYNMLNKLKSYDYDLLLIPDASSGDYEAHSLLKSKGKEIICLDHHPVNKYSEDALVVNNQLSKLITNKAMTGVGVVYKLLKAFDERLNKNLADDYLDVLAIGMVADSCDLLNLESRYLVLKGLKLIEDGESKNELIKAVIKEKKKSIENNISISNVAFYVCPLINSIIRGGTIQQKELLFKCFIGEVSTDKIINIYEDLKAKQDRIVEESMIKMDEQIRKFNLDSNEIIVLNGKDIEDSTYSRIIVNKVVEKYKRHAIILREYYKGMYGGSATGCRNKEIVSFRDWCTNSGLFDLSAGHDTAFSTRIFEQNIDKLYSLISTIPTEDILTYEVDGIFNSFSINSKLVLQFSKYKNIWGNKVDEPLFAIEKIKINSENLQLMGSEENTIKFKYEDVDFIKFKTSKEEFFKIITSECNEFTFIGKFSSNTFRGKTTAQIILEDFKYKKCEKVNKEFKF